MKKSKSQEPDKKLWDEVSKALTKLDVADPFDEEWKVVPREEKDYYDLYNEHDS
tara:strand:- start:1455 stop:1616 length:162 start_codon:yes stop_codon:yes gene_type:complete